MAKKRENKFLSFIAIIIVILFAGVIYIVVNSGNLYKNTSNIQPTSNQIYKSKNLKFSVTIPSKFKVDEKFSRVTLGSDKGNIYIEKSGTNLDDIDDYVKDLDIKNNSVTLNKEKLYVNELQAISGIVGGQKYYFIYADKWTIFTLFTDSSQLSSDLDKIAQSFKYTP